MQRDLPETAFVPPHSLEAEQSVLGGLMLSGGALERIEWLEVEHFYRGDHRLIFKAIRRLIEAGKQPDILLVLNDVSARGEDPEEFGGLGYLGAVCQATPSAHNIVRYAEIVREKYIRRQLMQHAMSISDAAMNLARDPQEIAEEAEEAFLSVLKPADNDETVSLIDAVDEAMQAEHSGLKGLSTGSTSMDRIIGGLREEELIVVAGRPGHGKSSLVMAIAEHAAKSVSVYIWSGEMSTKQIGKRSLAHHRHQLGDEIEATAHIASLRLEIDPKSPMSIGLLRMRLRRHKRQHGLGLLVVDYLQLMQGPKSENRNQEVGAISRGLKSLAKEFHIPVIAVASLNRGVENRADKRPVSADVRESGDIESDADIIMMVYRDKEYDPNTSWGDVGEIIVRKHREGGTGTALMDWHPEQTRFSDYVGEHPMRDAKPKQTRRRSFGDD